MERGRALVPSGLASQMRPRSPCETRTKAMVRPSGDQEGAKSMSGPPTNWVTPLPSAFMT